jgi:hypothetical protein
MAGVIVASGVAVSEREMDGAGAETLHPASEMTVITNSMVQKARCAREERALWFTIPNLGQVRVQVLGQV